ncbi:MAG: MFS transporter [Rhizobiaceae bacterium]
MTPSLRLPAVIMLLITGILAGAELGKIAPLVEWYRTERGFSLVLSGWLTAMIGLFVALAALPAGVAIERIGPRRTVLAGSLALAAGGLALAFLESPSAILAARLVEGLGYVILVIALPAVMAAISTPAWRATVLAIWSCFVPVGFGVSDLLAGVMLPEPGPASYLFVLALAYAIAATIGVLLMARVPDVDHRAQAAEAGGSLQGAFTLPVLSIAASFGLWVVMTVSFFSFMPTYVAGAGTVMLMSAGAVALTVPVGNVVASALVKGRDARFAAGLGAVGLVGTALLAWPAFGDAGPGAMTAAAVAVAILGGVTGSALYAAIPLVTPRGGSVAVAIGMVAQAGGIGTVIGPPLAGWVIERYGWPGFAAFTTLFALAATLAITPLLARKIGG